MRRWSLTSAKLYGWLLHWRWQIVFILSLLAVAIEVAEHQPALLYHIDVIVFAGIVPAFLGILLSGAARVQSRMIEGRKRAVEAERRELARQLHDSLGQQLAYLHLTLEYLSSDAAEKDLPAMQQHVANMLPVVKEAYSLVRSTLVDLDAPLQDDFAAAIHEMARRIGGRAGFRVSIESKGEPVLLFPHQQRQLLCIVREALTNIERHAHASRASIGLVWTDEALSLHVTDNGVGFEPAEPIAGHHLGLSFMQERAAEIGAQLNVNSRRGGGTALALYVPLEATQFIGTAARWNGSGPEAASGRAGA